VALLLKTRARYCNGNEASLSFFLSFFVNDCRAAGLLHHGIQPDWKIVAVISDFKKNAPYDLNERRESRFIFVTRRTRSVKVFTSVISDFICFRPYPFDLKESRELEALGFSKDLDFLASTSVCLCSVC